MTSSTAPREPSSRRSSFAEESTLLRGRSREFDARTLHRLGSTPRPTNPDTYLTELLSYSLDRLRKEPELLKQDSERISRQITATAVKQYEAFLAADRCLHALRTNVDQLNETLEGCLDGLPSFVSACEALEDGAGVAQKKWQESKKLLVNRERVSTLLEIPKLMETCVRNDNINEALDLQSFVHRLGVLHGDLTAVQSLTEASSNVRHFILTHLTDKLKSGIQLPECLSVVGHLRRLNVYSDRDLRLCFLLCREQWIESLVAELTPSQAFEFLKHLTDIHRLHLFDVAMQYKAIFSTETNEGDCGLLAEWALHRVTVYMDTLKATLPEIPDGASLLSLLETCMYCGMSLGRVGLDFRFQIVPLFEGRMLQLFKAKLDDALALFASQLETHRWTAPSLVQESSATDCNGASTTPPAELAKHLPLALFVNGFLSAMNELRHCAPVDGQSQVLLWSQEALLELASKLVRYEAGRNLDASQKAVFLSACHDVSGVLCPFISACLSAIYVDGGSSCLDVTRLVELFDKIDGYL